MCGWAYSRKKIDLTGRQYGHLTVLEPAENIGKRTAWVCQCGCGRRVVVKTCRLRSGRTKSCGCQNGSGSPGNALGLTYVDGTCVEMLAARTVRSNNTSGVPGVDWLAKKQRWRASICFKGKRRYLGSYEAFEDAVRAREEAEMHLFDAFLDAYSGKAPQSEPRDAEGLCPPRTGGHGDQRPDLTGRRFGQLTVLAPAETIGSMAAWRCRCSCGKEIVAESAHLRSGQTSCGCIQKRSFADGAAAGEEGGPAAGKWKLFADRRYDPGCCESPENAAKARRRSEEEYRGSFLEESR